MDDTPAAAGTGVCGRLALALGRAVVPVIEVAPIVQSLSVAVVDRAVSQVARVTRG